MSDKLMSGGLEFTTMLQETVIADKLDGAKWVWGGKDPRKENAYRFFRKEFDLADVPETAEVWAYAESKYKLYVNGRFVQAGPSLCEPDNRYIDRHNVTKYLRKGGNCIAFIVHCPGVINSVWTMVNAGLFAKVRIDDGRVEFGTDSSWQSLEGKAWQHPTAMCGYGKGWYEWCRLTQIPAGWNEADFDASGWENPVELPYFYCGQVDRFRENYTGYATLAEQLPVRLVKAGRSDGVITQEMKDKETEIYTIVRNRWRKLMGYWAMKSRDEALPADMPIPEPIAMRAHLEKHSDASEDMVIDTGGENGLGVTINVPQKGDPFVTFDLGVVQCGFIMLEVESDSGGTVDIASDDRVRDDGSVPCFRAVPSCERVEVPAGRVSWDSFFDRGMRYIQVILRGFKGNVTIHKVGIRETLTPVDNANTATFESDNDLLNRIWRAAVRTTRVYVNSSGCGAGDAIRERCHWFGDDTIALRMAFYCFGEWKQWRRALELTGKSQWANGCFPVMTPGNTEDYNMVAGSCYWVAAAAEYIRHTGDVQFAKEIFDKIDKHIEYETRFINKDGLLYETAGRRFLSWADGRPRKPYAPGETWKKTGRTTWGDWLNEPTKGYNAIINSYWLWSLREAADIAETLGIEQKAQKYKAMFQSARAAFDKMFWEEKFALYRDNVYYDRNGKKNGATFCESTLFLMMRAGIIEKQKGLECLDKMMEPDFICCRASGGLEMGALTRFLIDAGQTAKAIEYLLDRWGEPIKAGQTTCGEEFFHIPGNSDCHIHGGTPARDLLEYLAGIRIKSAWWDEVLLVPPVDSGNLPMLKASVPTPHGRIEVEISKGPASQKIYHYKLPDGCKGFIRTNGGINELGKPCGEVALPQNRV